jgi:NTE family protein
MPFAANQPSRIDHRHPVSSTPPLVDEPLSGEGMALTMSGGGFRAMLFHVGALWRLNELGVLSRLTRISSVSGGSITNGQLAAAWKRLEFRDGIATAFERELVAPIRELASHTIDWRAVLTGWFTLRPIANVLADIYDEFLFHGLMLKDLPDDTRGESPRFVFDATSMQSGMLFRFSRDHAGDYLIGRMDRPDFPLSHAVTSSSAFPPMLSPMVLDVAPGAVVPGSGKDLSRHPYTSRVVLTDGGVYDNLGLEAVWRPFRHILVSDASAILPPEPSPSRAWARQLGRAIDTTSAQVRDLRVRQLIAAYKAPESEVGLWRRGAYWWIASDISAFGGKGSLSCPPESAHRLASIPTRLKATSDAVQEQLINWGYAICDASMRRWVVPDAAPPGGFPYPSSGV